MEKKRCQVCDGPVVNGRCKLCGMPYRNDETLYHLNENRSTHYRHATSRAQAIMRQEEIPLGDKKAGSAAYKTGTGTGVAGAGNKYDQKTGTGSSKSLAGAGTGNFYNKGSVKAGSTYGGSTGAAKNGNKVSVPAGNYNSKSRQSTAGTYSAAAKKSSVYTQKPVKKKKGSLFGWLMVLVIICASLPEIRDSLKDSLAPILEEEFGDMFGSGADSASYKLMKGAVYYDGKDLDKIDLKSLRQKIGVVMQNGKLFQGDIYSNIVISAPWLTQKDAWEAAELAGIAEDIRKMPMGMNTMISEGSGGISGGQKQRLMIARAIAQKPRLLMLDEATSALDNLTQKKVSEALDGLKCTRIVIAHRLSTIKQCDRILVLDKGKIIEDGKYEELLEKNGFFAELVKRQRLDAL